ncbi:MAG: UDP-glucose 4-epimerase GalE [Acidimicrobiales bacterium]
MTTMGGNRRVLVAGGAGFIGSHTCVALIERGLEPVIVDTFENSHPWIVDRIENLSGHRPETYEVDVRDTEAITDILGRSIESVIHFAAFKAVGESVAEPLKYYDLNITGTVSLLRAMQSVGLRTLVFSGSCSIFGDTDRVPIPETAPLRPANPYAQTKAMCEQILTDHCATSDLSATSLRYFNPIGAHPSGELGEDPLGIPPNILPFIMQVATGHQTALKVYGDDYPTPDGTCIRDYIHVVDVARAHVRALEVHRGKAGFRALNLGTGVGTSVFELIEEVRRVTGHPIPVQIEPRRPGDVPTLVADPTRAESDLGWRCEHDLDAMVRHAWTYRRTFIDAIA